MADEMMKTTEETLAQFHEHGGEALLFTIDQTTYGVPIQYITEIIGVQPITIVPKVPYYIKGVINIRGKVVPVINIRNKIALPEIDFDEKTCIIVVDVEEITVGLIVDRVREVVNVNPNDICSTSEYKSINQNNYIEAIIDSGGEIKQLLNIHRLIEE
ncbi:MAG: chemotaxis protein CheW [Oscillospiraceae bacterium]|jgi:purine-binding chemotaxis protein CheW|nr:chemotaxis protein CheW [Oscillospiraceae bacterium]